LLKVSKYKPWEIQSDTKMNTRFDLPNDLESVRKFLENQRRGLGPVGADAHSYSALHYAVACSNNDIVFHILERFPPGTNGVNSPDRGGNTPLILATANGNLEQVKALVAHGADVNRPNFEGKTPLHVAAMCNHNEILLFLINHGANIAQKTFEGETALHFACAMEHEDTALSLLSYAAPPNAQDNEGDTPLHWVVREGYVHLLKALVKHGADLNVRNEDAESALELASCLGQHEMVEFLRAQVKSSKEHHDVSVMQDRGSLDFSSVSISMDW
jgi:ankyrin repeat protein